MTHNCTVRKTKEHSLSAHSYDKVHADADCDPLRGSDLSCSTGLLRPLLGCGGCSDDGPCSASSPQVGEEGGGRGYSGHRDRDVWELRVGLDLKYPP